MFREAEHISVMNTGECGLTMIKVVFALTKFEIEDVNAEHFLYILVHLPPAHVFGDGLCYTIEHALKVIGLTGLLDFNKDNLALRVLSFDVNTIVLIIPLILVGFAFKQLYNAYLLLHQHGDETFENDKVCLVAENVLRCPVKPNILTATHLCSFPFVLYFFFHSYYDF